MSKRDLLTQEEYDRYFPNERILNYLRMFQLAQGLRSDEIKVLDWGCGRGRFVLWLRQRGYQAYGVDIDPLPIENGLPLIREQGFSADILRLLDENGRTDFADGHFDFTLSGQVFEHVANIDQVAAEIQRLTRQGGMGFHEYPSYRYLVEPHLYMPFVHWLPKNALRRLLIRFFVWVGIEPHWPEVEEKSLGKKVETYYHYSLEKTHYRKPGLMKKTFEQHGFSVIFKTIDHPRITEHRLLGRLAKGEVTRRLLDHLLLTFRHQELSITKL